MGPSLSGGPFPRHLMASEQWPLREGGVWDGEPEPWRVGAVGTSKEVEVSNQHWLIGNLQPQNWGCQEDVSLLGMCLPSHDISGVALLAFPDSEAEPVPSLPDSLIRIVPLTHQYQNPNPSYRPSQALLPLAANAPRLLVASKARHSKHEALHPLRHQTPPSTPRPSWPQSLLEQPDVLPLWHRKG